MLYLVVYLYLILLTNSVLASKSMYSIGVASKNGEDQVATLQIVVNGENYFAKVQELDVPEEGMEWYDFEAKPGDTIEVRFTAVDNPFHLYYVINNGPKGSRTDIYNSTSRTFITRNKCTSGEEACDFKISNAFQSSWDSSTANVFVNNTKVVSDFDGTGSASFSALKDDEIRIEFNFDSSDKDIGYAIQKLRDPIDFIEWYYDSFGTIAMIPNPYSDVMIEEVEDGVSAGSDLMIKLVSNPEAKDFIVLLSCGDGLEIQGVVQSNTLEPVKFPVLSSLFGDVCVLSVEKPIAGLNTKNIIVTQPVTLSTKDLNVSYLFNTLPIQLIINSTASSTSYGVTVIQTCGSETGQYDDIPVGQYFDVNIPADYVGTCTFKTTAKGVFQATENDLSVEFVKGTVEIVEFANKRISAVSEVPIELNSNPSGQEFTIQLDCGVGLLIVKKIKDSGMYPIPESFKGDCKFAVIDQQDLYEPINNFSVTITQDLSFKSPKVGEVVVKPDAIPINLIPGYLTDLKDTIDLEFDCGNGKKLFNVETNVEFQFSEYSDQDNGLCKIGIVSAPDYYEIIQKEIEVYLKTRLVIERAPLVVTNGKDFEVMISTVTNQITDYPRIDMEILCEGVVLQKWIGVPLNSLQTLNMYNTLDKPSKCLLRTTDTVPLYTQAEKWVQLILMRSPTGGPMYFFKDAEHMGRHVKKLGAVGGLWH